MRVKKSEFTENLFDFKDDTSHTSTYKIVRSIVGRFVGVLGDLPNEDLDTLTEHDIQTFLCAAFDQYKNRNVKVSYNCFVKSNRYNLFTNAIPLIGVVNENTSPSGKAFADIVVSTTLNKMLLCELKYVRPCDFKGDGSSSTESEWMSRHIKFGSTNFMTLGSYCVKTARQALEYYNIEGVTQRK
jgi:hypothetical protein